MPEIRLISDLRLLDIIIWTAQDDRIQRPGKAAGRWLSGAIGERIPVETVAPVML